MSFLEKLRGLAGDATRAVSDETTRIVTNDLKRLDEVDPGLGRKAVDYVLKGSDGTCLATISNLAEARKFNVGFTWARDEVVRNRWKLFHLESKPDTALLARYAEVLASFKGLDLKILAGTTKVPLTARILFTEVFAGTGGRYRQGVLKISGNRAVTSLSFERALEIVTALGGEEIDLFDVLYQEDNSYGRCSPDRMRSAFDMNGYARKHLDTFLAAGKRVHAIGRSDFMDDLVKWGLLQDRRVVGFLMREAGGSAKVSREKALSCLTACSDSDLLPIAVEALNTGNVNERAGMVRLLAGMNSQAANEALKSHLETEKSARVRAAIETTIAVSDIAQEVEANSDDEHSYQAIDGSRIEIPAFTAIAPFGEQVLSKSDLGELQRAVKAVNEERQRQYQKDKAAGQKWARYNPISTGETTKIFELLNGKSTKAQWHHLNHIRRLMGNSDIRPWVDQALGKLTHHQKLRVSHRILGGTFQSVFNSYWQDTFSNTLEQWLDGEDGDVRALIDLDISSNVMIRYHGSYGPEEHVTQWNTFLRSMLRSEYFYGGAEPTDMAPNAVWPYMAAHLDVFDEALGLKPESAAKLSSVQAIRLLTLFPKTPMRYFGVLLEAATGEGKRGRAEARQLLADVDGVDERLIVLLDDGRQAVRAGAAEWLADRKHEAAKPALHKRLKKERSELARAAMLTTLEQLGDDISKYIGPKALVEEAEKGLKKAKFDKLDWLAFNALGGLRFKSKKAVPEDIVKHWIYQAFKLKQPGGNKLFELYLDQLAPESAEALSTWIVESWIAYDTATATDDEANAYANQHIQQRWQSHQNWLKKYKQKYGGEPWVKSMEETTEEMLFEQLKREIKSHYKNSGAATKGLLGLGTRAPSTLLADRARAFLKNHGKRTSQASAILDLLAACGDPVSLQVVISASTRLKQKGVQAYAGELLERVARQKNWTMNELADRTIPTGGFDDNGILELVCTPAEKTYSAILDDDLKLILKNPDGKAIKSLPSGDDEHTKISKKLLSTARKEVKQVVSMQSQRLYEALCAERSWSVEDWSRDLHNHPLMGQLIQHLVWAGLNEDGDIVAHFRPTAEGELINLEDDDVPLEFDRIRLAHGALLDETTANAWSAHLKDYEIKPLFQQFGRKLLRLSDEQKGLSQIDDRRGWLTDSFTIRGAATKLGMERGEALDAGWFHQYQKAFPSASLAAVFEFTGSYLPEENIPAAIMDLTFEKIGAGGRLRGKVKLKDVPPVLLSECWNDYYALAAKGQFDADWEKKAGW